MIITLVLADDYPLARAGIHAMLTEAPDIQIVGEAKDGAEVRELVIKFRPRILLLDLKMPGCSPVEVERWVRANYPGTATLILTGHDRDVYLAGMMKAGAAGYLSKSEASTNLIEAIRRAANGEKLFTESQYARVCLWRERAGDRLEDMTEREREILEMLLEGSSNALIARTLGVSPKTVAYHVTSILVKLGVSSRQEAIVWAYKYWPDGLE